jgi:hypothetical protein
VNYDSLQVTANRRFSKGLAFGAAYTLSKTLGMTGALSVTSDPYQRDYGYQGTDRRHILSFNWSWNAPNGSAMWNNWLTRGALDGWQFAGVGFVRSGTPSTVSWSTTDAGGTDTMGGGDAARITVLSGCDPILPRSQQTDSLYFNTSCFVRTPKGSLGTAQPIVRQPGSKNLDLSLSKSFPLGAKGQTLQFRADIYNALRVIQQTVGTSATFDPAGNQTNSNFGTLALPTDEARQIELSLRFRF